MEAPKVEQLPPVTIEFLRIVNGVEGARLCCKDCNAVHAMSWDYLGLPDDTPFPPPEGFWTCGLCGGKHVTAEPEWPYNVQPEKTVPVDDDMAVSPSSTAPVDSQNSVASMRDQLESVMLRLRKSSG